MKRLFIILVFIIFYSFTSNQYAEEALIYADTINYNNKKDLVARGSVKIISQNQVITSDLAIINGIVREILTKERLILNMIQHLSGITSNSAKYLKKLNNSKIKILDTRKTTPGLRLLEKYAVNKGGGHNHRLNLSAGVMIKDNHMINNNTTNIQQKLEKLKNKTPIQMEIDNIKQITQENVEIVDAFLLDNMSPDRIKKCINKINRLNKKSHKIFIEISGGVTLKNISQYNIEGICGISIGALTHKATSKDIGLDITPYK